MNGMWVLGRFLHAVEKTKGDRSFCEVFIEDTTENKDKVFTVKQKMVCFGSLCNVVMNMPSDTMVYVTGNIKPYKNPKSEYFETQVILNRIHPIYKPKDNYTPPETTTAQEPEPIREDDIPF